MVVGFELWTLDSDTNYLALGRANVNFASFGVFLFFDLLLCQRGKNVIKIVIVVFKIRPKFYKKGWCVVQ